MPAAVNEHVFILRAKETILAYYLYCIVRAGEFQERLRPFIKGIIGGISLEFGRINVPLPPLSVQEEIVAEIEGYQKVIDGARAVIENYRPHISIDPEWPVVALGEIAEIKLGKMLDKAKHTTGLLLPYIRNINVRWGAIDTENLPKMYFKDDDLERFGLQAGDVLVCEGGDPGRAAVWDGSIPEVKYQKAIHRVRFKVSFEPVLLVYFLRMIAGREDFKARFSGSTIKHLTRDSFIRLPIPLPPLTTQQAIVAEIEAEQALVAANRELIARMEQKIQATLARVWGEEEPRAEGRKRHPVGRVVVD